MKPITLKKIEKALHADQGLNISELTAASSVSRRTLNSNQDEVKCIKELKVHNLQHTYRESVSICATESVHFCNDPLFNDMFQFALVHKLGFHPHSGDIGDETAVGCNDTIMYTSDGYLHGDHGKLRLQVGKVSAIEMLALAKALVIDSGKATRFNIQKILSSLATLALDDLKLIRRSFSQKKRLKYGEVIFNLYLDVIQGSGRVHSTNSSRTWLYREDTLDLESKLFTKSGYAQGNHSMKFKPTPLMEEIILRVWENFKTIEFADDNSLVIAPLDEFIDIALCAEVGLRDALVLLGSCIGICDGKFVIRPFISDYQQSRVYSYQTAISSSTREALGLHEYDMGTGQQSIVLQVVPDPSLYPLHQKLVADKQTFRREVSEMLNISTNHAKESLNAINGDPWNKKTAKRIAKYPLLVDYMEEAKLIVEDFLYKGLTPDMLKVAKRFAKINKKMIFDEDGQPTGRYKDDGKSIPSMYFFGWTQIERSIREIMMTCFKNPVHQVHDAVWSHEIIDPKVIEQKIYDATGMTICINK